MNIEIILQQEKIKLDSDWKSWSAFWSQRQQELKDEWRY
jgi:hypothetical protein